MRFSANLGFLWADLPLPRAVAAAAASGFDAVECHWPYAIAPAKTRAALEAAGLPLLALNTRPGEAGEFGLTALPDRRTEARAAIDEAIAYAVATGAQAVHVMAGRATGRAAEAAFLAGLEHACDQGARHGVTVLVEPLNPQDVPGYFLNSFDRAGDLIASAGHSNLKLMFDCYHAGKMGLDVIAQLRDLMPLIGHIQIAAIPDRGPPDHGTLDYPAVFAALADMGWTRPLGAEYRVQGPTEATLGWLDRWQQPEG